MNTRTLTLTASAIFGGRHSKNASVLVDVEAQRRVLVDHEPIRVVLPHGEMELHTLGNVLSREEYYKLTQAVGLMEARTVMSHHGLRVGEAESDDLAAVGGRHRDEGAGGGAGAGSDGRIAEPRSDADLSHFADELAA